MPALCHRCDRCSLCQPKFVVENTDGDAVFTIDGPACICQYMCCYGDVEFPVTICDFIRCFQLLTFQEIDNNLFVEHYTLRMTLCKETAVETTRILYAR